MDIRQEKEFIYNMMNDITIERRNLSEMYFDLKKRLDKLDDIEMRGLDDISVDGYFNLHEQRQRKLSASNIRRELDNLDRKLNQENPETQRDSGIYQPPVSEVKRELEKSVEKIEKPAEPEQKIPESIIEEAKVSEKENSSPNKTKGKTKGKRQNLDFRKVGAIIRIILKEKGEPMNLPDLQKEVQSKLEMELTTNNFRQNLIYRVNKEFDDIVRVGRGYYKFVPNEENIDAIKAKSPKKKDKDKSEAEPVAELEEKQEKFELQTVK